MRGLTGAARWQSVLDPAGPESGHIAHLWWLMLTVCTAVFLLVMVVLLLSIFHRREEENDAGARDVPGRFPPEAERRMRRNVTIATAVTVVVLFALLIASVTTGRAISTPLADRPLTIEIVGHQWWWEIHYDDPVESDSVLTANEIHIPVGRPVLIQGTSHDVIHSFWVPNLNGKKDLIPGHFTSLWIQADRPGVYRGQCAEFCGFQHANMALLVIAEPADRFQAWLAQQRREAPPPSTPEQARGKQLVEILPCANCHTVRGTLASGKTAPDLTHFASRRTLAAGTLPNSRGNLGGWIADPQTVKPGNHMPSVSIPSEELEAVLAYLETLQ
jgi:cytochrome c oxidase subunit 2